MTLERIASHLMNDYDISCDPTRLDLDVIHGFLTTSYWSPGIPKATVKRAIDNSICFGVYKDAQQVGFARVITDKTSFAYLADVFVLEPHRGQGLSHQLMKVIQAHPDLQSLRRWLLVTRDMQALYSQHGFTPLAAPGNVMELHRPNVYQV